jgi:hypothetical protein
VANNGRPRVVLLMAAGLESSLFGRTAVAVVLVAVWTGAALLVIGPRRGSTTVRRMALTLAAAVTAWILAWIFWSVPGESPSDIAPIWAGARALLRGQNPYDIVGPGRSFDTTFPLIYPLTAVLTLAPLALAPLRWADLIFVTLGFGLFTWAVTRRGQLTPALVALVSLPALMVLQTSQWSLLLTGAALLPSLGFLLVAKPTIGLALFGAFPSWRTAIGCVVFLSLSVLIWPTWLADWHAGLVTAPHVVAPITRVGGPLVLLALLKWRRADARLLAGLACVPHTTALYEITPLFLIAETWGQAWGIWTLTVLAHLGQAATGPYPSHAAEWGSEAQWIVALVYLPCLGMVLVRPNVWSGGALSERDDWSSSWTRLIDSFADAIRDRTRRRHSLPTATDQRSA